MEFDRQMEILNECLPLKFICAIKLFLSGIMHIFCHLSLTKVKDKIRADFTPLLLYHWSYLLFFLPSMSLFISIKYCLRDFESSIPI